MLIRNEVGKGILLKSPFSDSVERLEPEDDGASSDPEAAQAVSVKDIVEGVVESDDMSDVGDAAVGVSEDETELKVSEPMYV